MADENQPVVVTDQNADEEVKVDLNIPDDGATTEQVAPLKKGVQTLSAQKKYWRDAAVDPATGKKWKDIAAERAARGDQPDNHNAQVPGDLKEIKGDVDYLKTVEEKRQFGHQHNLSPEAVDNVFAHARGRNIKPDEALKDTFVKRGLEALSAEERTRNAVPRPSHRTAVVGGKSIGEMKPEERRANWGKVTGADRS